VFTIKYEWLVGSSEWYWAITDEQDREVGTAKTRFGAILKARKIRYNLRREITIK
jgi:hypothetical protein